MGNPDKWSTPKQIKIEREGEPRGTRRGAKRKGERRKGIKARLDELLSSRRTLQRYAQWILDERDRRKKYPHMYTPRPGVSFYDPHYEQWFDEQQKKHDVLLAKAMRDKVIGSFDEWEVVKP